MSKENFILENSSFLINTDLNDSSVVKLQGIKPQFFYENLVKSNYIELNVNNEAVAPFFNELVTLFNIFEQKQLNNTKETSVKLYLGLYFVELDMATKAAPLIIVPVVAHKTQEKFELSCTEDARITLNPFISDYLPLNFGDFESLDSYIDAVYNICEQKDYLLKKLSLLGMCNVVNPVTEIELTKTTHALPYDTREVNLSNIDFNVESEVNIDASENKFENKFQNKFKEEIQEQIQTQEEIQNETSPEIQNKNPIKTKFQNIIQNRLQNNSKDEVQGFIKVEKQEQTDVEEQIDEKERNETATISTAIISTEEIDTIQNVTEHTEDSIQIENSLVDVILGEEILESEALEIDSSNAETSETEAIETASNEVANQNATNETELTEPLSNELYNELSKAKIEQPTPKSNMNSLVASLEKQATLDDEEAVSIEVKPKRISDIIKNANIENFNNIDVSQKTVESQLIPLQIHPFSQNEKDILFYTTLNESFKVGKTNKSKILPLLSNMILASLVQNKKVLYLTNNEQSTRALFDQIQKDGFDEYLLYVHNNVIQNTSKTLFNIPRKKTTFKKSKLEELLDSKVNLRIELNEYLKTSHKVFESMNLTLLDVVQKIINLKEENNIYETYDVHFPNIVDFSPLDLHRYTFHLNNYVKFFEASQIDIQNTFWKNLDFSVVDKSDVAKAEEILKELKNKIKYLQTNEVSIVSTSFNYKPSDVKQFYNLYTNINDEIFSTDYIYNLDHGLIIANLDKLIHLQNKFTEYQKEVYDVFDDSIFSTDILLINKNLQKNANSLVELLNDNNLRTATDVITNLDQINKAVTSLYESISESFGLADEISDYFGLSTCDSIYEMNLLIEMFSFIFEHGKLNAYWFDDVQRSAFISNLTELIEIEKTVNQIKKEISQKFTEAIYEADFTSLTNELLKSNMQANASDKIAKFLKDFAIDPEQNITFDEATKIIANLKEIKLSQPKYAELSGLTSLFLSKPTTNFESLLANVKIFEETLLAFDYNIPEVIKLFLLEPTSNLNIFEDFNTLYDILNNKVATSGYNDKLQDLSRVDVLNQLNQCVTTVDESKYMYDKILSYSKHLGSRDTTLSSEQVISATKKITRLIDIQEEFERTFEATSKKIPNFLTSYTSDIEQIRSDLEVFRQIYRLLAKFQVSETDFYDFAKTIRQEILANTQKFNHLIDETISLFKVIFDFANNTKEICQNYEEDFEFVETLEKDLILVKEGYKFIHSKEECEKLLLSEFLLSVENNEIEPNQIINTFLVSFYTSWLKETLRTLDIKDYTSIHKKIDEYFEVSKNIYLYTKSTLNTKVSDFVPRLTLDKSSVDEVNVLFEEIIPTFDTFKNSKNSKNKNFDNNFKNIFGKVPNLLFELKPLLITTFNDYLESDVFKQFNFDLIIIDNATNILPTNKSILNLLTKQVILFGDSSVAKESENVFDKSGEMPKVDISALKTPFNLSIAEFLNTNYYENQLFIPYSKNFALDFKNEVLDKSENAFNNGVNEAEANRTIDLLKDFYSLEENKDKTSQVVSYTAEQTSLVEKLIQNDHNLSERFANGLMSISSLTSVNIVVSNLSILNLCYTSLDEFKKVTSTTEQNLVKVLLNTVNSLYIVESLDFSSDIENTLLLNKLINQFTTVTESTELDTLKHKDLLTKNITNFLLKDFDAGFSNQNNVNNIYVKDHNNIKLLVQTDQFVNSKVDFDEIYLKQIFTEQTDNVKILNVFSYSWYLSDDYKQFITDEVTSLIRGEQTTTEPTNLLIEDVIESTVKGNYFGLSEYEQADLYEIEPVTDVTIFVANAIAHIVRIESPIHVDLVEEKLKSLLGASSSSFNLTEIIQNSLENYLMDMVTIKNDFYWNKADASVTPRVPSNIATTRYISQIADEELEAILCKIVDKSFGITPDSLITTCCSELGFTSPSNTIKNKISSSYKKLLKEKVLVLNNNKLKLN